MWQHAYVWRTVHTHARARTHRHPHVHTPQSDRDAFPFGQCPRFDDGDLHILQSNTILRYPGMLRARWGANACVQHVRVQHVRVQHVHVPQHVLGRTDQAATAFREISEHCDDAGQ